MRGVKQNKDWPVIKIGDACNIINGATPLRSNNAYWEGGTIPWFTVKDIREQGRTIKYTQQKITKVGLNESSIKVLPRKSVLLCCTASVGEYAFTNIELTTNQQFNALVIKDEWTDKLIPEFLFILSGILKKELIARSGKTAFEFVSMEQLSQIEIPMPPIKYQQEIVDAIGFWDRAIDLLEKAIISYRFLRKGTIQNLWNNELYKYDAEEIKTIGVFYRGQHITKEELLSRGMNKCIHYGQLYTEYDEVIDSVISYTNIKPKVVSHVGDILIPGSTTAGALGIATASTLFEKNVVIGGDINLFRIKDIRKHDPAFISYSLSNYPGKIQLASLAEGTTIKHLNPNSIGTIKLRFPPIKRQREIVNILSNFDKHIRTRKLLLDKYQKQKQGLIQSFLLS